MNQVLSPINCKCKKKSSLTKKRKKRNRRIIVPYPNDLILKTFQLKYEKNLSLLAKFILTSLQNKYFYYAIDDILYILKSNSVEQENLLTILYSTVLSLHNNLSINFFDVWIHEIQINEVARSNKFLDAESQNFEPFYYITIKLLYRKKVLVKKQESLW